MSCSHEVFALRKEQKIDEALAKARECYRENPTDAWVHRAYGWVLYDLLKHHVAEFEEKRVSPGHLANRFSALLGEYRQFGASVRPDLLHSMLLTQVLKGARVWSGFLDFARWWGPEYFREEDKQPYIPPEGRETPSLLTRFIYAVGREASHRVKDIPPDLLAWAEAQLDGALQASPNDQWLHYYKSKLLSDRGETGKARTCLLPVVRRQQRAAWVWTLLGQTYERDEPTKAITCYFRAVQLAHEPQEVANTRISLARLLVIKQRFEEATVQVRSALSYRTENNFRIPQELGQLAAAAWYQESAGRLDLPREPDVSAEAEAVLLGEDRGPINFRLGVIDNQNADKALAHAAFNPDDRVVLPYRYFRDIDHAAIGDVVEVGMSEADGHAVKWRGSEAKAIKGFAQRMTGVVTQRDEQAFGFLMTSAGERVFIHPKLMVELAERCVNMQVCVAMMGKDKSGKVGWRALCWLKEIAIDHSPGVGQSRA